VNTATLFYTWNTFSTVNEINTLAWSFGAVVLYHSVDDRDELHQALIIGSLLLALSAVIQLKILLPGLAQAFTGGKYGLIVREQIAPFGAFLNQNMLGGYFLYVLPLALYFVAVRKRLTYGLAASVLMLGILLSLSRLAMIIGFAGILPACALLGRKANPRRWLIKLTCSVGCALLLFGLLLHGEGRERASSMRGLLTAKVERVSTEIRTLDKRAGLWSDSFRAFRSKPIVGYGAGTFEYAYRKFYDGGLYTKYAHSSLVKTAVELGCVGVLTLFLYLAAFGRGILRNLQEPGSKFLAISACAGLLFGLVDFAFDAPAHVVTFFVVTSAFLASGQNRKPMAAGKPLLLAIIVLLLFSFLFTGKADFSRKLIEDGIFFEETGLYTEAYEAYRDAIQAMPLNNEGYTRTVAILLKSYDNEKDPEKKEEVKRALNSYLGDTQGRNDQDAELYYVRGMGYAALAPGKDACVLISNAILLYPSSALYRYEAARCYAKLGDFDKALSVIRPIQPYLAAFQTSGNPQGLFVYKLRDLEADIEHARGNPGKALVIGRENLRDGVSGKYSISNTKAREFLPKEALIRYLTEKVSFYQKAAKDQSN
jgi:tetratricopeptide (TPR) repeat protein